MMVPLPFTTTITTTTTRRSHRHYYSSVVLSEIRGGGEGEGRSQAKNNNVNVHHVPVLLRKTRPHFQIYFGRGFAPLFSSLSDDSSSSSSSSNASDSDSNSDSVAAMDSDSMKQQQQQQGKIGYFPSVEKGTKENNNHNNTGDANNDNNAITVRRLGKAGGMLVGIPIYLLVRFIQLGWIRPSLRWIDIGLARTVGLLLDGCVYIAVTIVWSILSYFLIPLSTLMWIPIKMIVSVIGRILNNIYHRLLYPVWNVVVILSKKLVQYVVTILDYLNTILFEPLMRIIIRLARTLGTRLHSLYIYLMDILTSRLLQPLLNKVLRPFWEGACNGYKITAECLNQYLILPLFRYVLTPLWHILTFVLWKCLARPVLKTSATVGVYVIRGGLAICQGMGRYLQYLYTQVIIPIQIIISRKVLFPILRIVKIIFGAIIRPINLLWAMMKRKWSDITVIFTFYRKEIRQYIQSVIQDLLLFFSSTTIPKEKEKQ